MGAIRRWASSLVGGGNSGKEVATSDGALLDHISGFSKPEQNVNGMGLFLLASNNPGENTRIASAVSKYLGDPTVTVRGFAEANQIQVMVPQGGDLDGVRTKLNALIARNQEKGLGAMSQEQMAPLRSVTGARARQFNQREIVELALDAGMRDADRSALPTLLTGMLGQFGVQSVALDGNTALLFTAEGTNNAELATKIDEAARGVQKGGRTLAGGNRPALGGPKE